MRNITLLAIIISCQLSIVAQPTDNEIKQRVVTAGALETRFTSEKGTIHTTLTEKWYMRTLESKWKTQYPGITRWERNEYRYDFIGGKWVFKRSYQNSSWYDGIPNPSEQEIFILINNNLPTYLSTAGELIGDPESIKLASDPKWIWDDLRKVTCLTEAVFTRKVNQIGDAEKVKQVFAIKLFRDTDDKNAPFVRFFSTAEGEVVVLQKTKYAVEEDKSPFAELNQNNSNTNETEKEPVYPKFSVNDLVIVNWNGQGKDFYKGKIIKFDPYDENRYFIEFEKIQSVWIHAKFITKQ